MRVASSMAGLDGCRVGQQTGEGDNFNGLLVGEGQPAAQLRGELDFLVDVVRDVLGGGGGADGQLGHRLLQFGDLLRGGGEVVAPDVVAVHDAGDEGLVAQRGQGRGGGDLALEDVQVQGVDAGGGEGAELAVERAVRGGDEQLRALGRGGEGLVGAGDGGLDFHGRGVLVHHEGGLVELDPAGAGGGELLKQRGVDGEDVLEAGQRAEAGRGVVGGLAQQQERDRADDVRAGFHAVGEGVLEFLDDPAGGQREVGLRADFRHEVVVVGVEPLGHFQRLLVLVAAGQGEVAVDVELALGVEEVPEAGRHGAEVGGGVEHLVVVGEGAGDGRGLGQAQALEALGGAELDFLGGGVQGGGVDLAGPVGLDGLLEFAAAADARVAEDRGRREGSGVGVCCSVMGSPKCWWLTEEGVV